MKKLIAVLLTLMMLCTAAGAMAASYRTASARGISLNQTVADRLSNGKPVVYSFTVTQPGWVTLTFDHDYANEQESWYVRLIDRDGNRILWMPVNAKSEWAEQSPRVGLTPGTWYIAVEGFSTYSYPTPQYRFRVDFTADKHFEQEFNNRMGTANDIAVGTAVSGAISDDGDKDFYRFTLSRPANVRIDFSNDYDKKNSWAVSIVSDRGERMSFASFAANDEWVRSSDWVKLPAGTWYVKVESLSSGFWSTATYTFTVVAE